MSKLDEFGREVNSGEVRAVPLKYLRQNSRDDDIRRIIRQELSRQAEAEHKETFEESDDFDVGDDFDPSSPYEMLFDPEIQNSRSDFVEEIPSSTDKPVGEQPPVGEKPAAE